MSTTDAAGKTILITGATDGLGRATASRLAAGGARVLVHGRDRDKAQAASQAIAAETGSGRLRPYGADLASLAEVRRLAGELDQEEDRIDVLVNNAGVGGVQSRRESTDGYELNFAVNYLAPFLLTNLLLNRLQRSAPARIVNVSSVGQAALDFDHLQLERDYEAFRAYAQSKLAQIMFTFELAQRLRADDVQGVTVNALHPASLMDTKMVRNYFGRPRSSIRDGVEPLLRLVLDPRLDGVSGRYFDRFEESRANAQAYDPDARRRLWRLSEELVGAVKA
jgi:NAD(P)-dependent dehydrogenase (short-subunit alcohol dehydrogenase family)